jgi:hypothetical protein
MYPAMQIEAHRSLNATRVARTYVRRRQGRRVLQIEVGEAELADALVEAELLDPNFADDNDAVTAAATKLLEIFSKGGKPK